MKKIELHPEELRVESFPTAAAEPARGTVRGAAATPATGCAICATNTLCAGTQAFGGSCFNGCTVDDC